MILDGHAPWTRLQMRALSRHCMSIGQLQVQGPTHQPASRLFRGWQPAVWERCYAVSIFSLDLNPQHLPCITWMVSLKLMGW